MKQKIQPKDLITTGIFTAIMFVICMGVAMLGYIPIFIPLLSVLVPLVGGIPFISDKSQKVWHGINHVCFDGAGYGTHGDGRLVNGYRACCRYFV